MKIQIKNILTSKSNILFPDLITLVCVSVEKEVEGRTLTLSNFWVTLAEPTGESFIEYSNISESSLQNWVELAVQDKQETLDNLFSNME